MIKIAHASRNDAAKNREKRRKEQRAKAKAAWGAMPEEKRKEILKRRFAPDLKQSAAAVMYDIENNHITSNRAKETLQQRLDEINEEINKNPDILQYRKEEQEKIRRFLNDIDKKI